MGEDFRQPRRMKPFFGWADEGGNLQAASKFCYVQPMKSRHVCYIGQVHTWWSTHGQEIYVQKKWIGLDWMSFLFVCPGGAGVLYCVPRWSSMVLFYKLVVAPATRSFHIQPILPIQLRADHLICIICIIQTCQCNYVFRENFSNYWNTQAFLRASTRLFGFFVSNDHAEI